MCLAFFGVDDDDLRGSIFFSFVHSLAGLSIRGNDTVRAKLTDYGQVVVRQIKCRSIIMDTSIKRGIILGSWAARSFWLCT